MADYLNDRNMNDAGNTSSSSISLTQTTNTIRGTLNSSDLDDWFRFTPTTSGTVSINLTGLSVDADVYLYQNPSSNFIACPYSSGTSNESISAQVTANQTYYIRVNDYDKASTNYNLSVNLPATSSTPAVTTSNDDYASAVYTTGSISVNNYKTGSIESNEDKDWFKIQLNAGQKIQVDLKGSPTSSGSLSDTYIGGIYNSSGTLINNTSDDDAGEGNNSQVTFTASTAGTYYIEAKAYQSLTGTYTLAVTSVNPPSVKITQNPTSAIVSAIQGYNTTYSHGSGGAIISDSLAKWAIDFDTPNSAGTNALAVGNGVVVAVHNGTSGYGNYVTVEHTIEGNVFYATYAHLESISAAISTNTIVAARTVLGEVGNSGLKNTDNTYKTGYDGAHLHLQLGTRISNNIADGSQDSKSPVYFDFMIDSAGKDGLFRTEQLGSTDIIGTSTDSGWTPDRLFGTDNGERIFGLAGNDIIKGEGGNDTIYGGRGDDSLYGGSGNDTFVFDVTPFGNKDRLYDFDPYFDTIALKSSIYQNAGFIGNLSSSYFKFINQTQDSNDYILYDNYDGTIYYDADANGSGAKIAIAVLDWKPQNLSASDFIFFIA